MTRTSTIPRRTTLATVVVALLLALVPVTGSASADEHTGTVSGTVFTKQGLDGGRAPDGRVAFIDVESGDLVDEAIADAAGNYSIELPAADYITIIYNSSDGVDFEEYFPELYSDKPLFDLDPTIVTVTAGATLDVDGSLAPLFFDMFDSIFTDEIFFLRNAGVTRGCNPDDGNTLYCPDDNVTRGQMAAFLVRFLGLTEVDADADFRDIGDSVFRDDIRKLATAEVTRGCNPEDGNTRFCPDEPVTRGAMAAFITRAVGLSEVDEDVDFDDIGDSVFRDDIRKLATAEITRGCNPDDGNTSFCPDEPVTRGQMAAFLFRTAEFIVEQILAEGGAEEGSSDTAAFQRRDVATEARPSLRDR